MSILRINCDLGEMTGNDADLMPFIDACSIACGGHIGDVTSMTEAVRLAKACHVRAGAHPSYPDRKNFGRSPMPLDNGQLKDSLMEQIQTLEKVCLKEGMKLDHVKPHGALYNQAAKAPETAQTVLEVMACFPQLKLYVPWQSVIAEMAAKERIPVIYEAFADRKYDRNLQLVPRSNPDGLIQTPKEALDQARSIFMESQVKTYDGVSLSIKADTLCVHGDNPAAIAILKELNQLKKELAS